MAATKRRPEVIREPIWDTDDISARLGIKPATVRVQCTSHPQFPAPAKVSGNARLWWQSDVEAWISQFRPNDTH